MKQSIIKIAKSSKNWKHAKVNLHLECFAKDYVLLTFISSTDAWYHQPSGLLYLGCSTVANKRAWLPNADFFAHEKLVGSEYMAILDTKATGPYSSRIKRIQTPNFQGHDGKGTLLLHGIGAFVGKDGLGGNADDQSLRLFLINHRVQVDPHIHGANSTVELFETTLGSDTMTHIKTFAHPDIFTPNNLVPTGPESFYFTNDHSVKKGWQKQLDLIIPGSGIGHCDAKGCKMVIEKTLYPNGLAGALNYPSKEANILYQASTTEEFVYSYEIQADKSLILKDKIRSGYPGDNINMASDGSLILAAFAKLLKTAEGFSTKDPNYVVPSTVVRISKNQGKDAFYGNKYNVEKLFEDDGNVVSFQTNAQLDSQRNLLFLSGTYLLLSAY